MNHQLLLPANDKLLVPACKGIEVINCGWKHCYLY